MKKLVLLSNDDGVTSPGLLVLREAWQEVADVVVLAPESEQSATSHALSLHRPLRLRELESGLFALDGTPADCVYVALHAEGRIVSRRPDLVMSGINHGLNLGQDVFYSGTVAAAREGALRKIPSIATSAHTGVSLQRAAEASVALGLRLLDAAPFAETPLLNLNFPEDWNGTIVGTSLGTRLYDEVVDFRTDPRGRAYLWLGGPGVSHDAKPGTDTEAYDHKAASVTPLVLDLTAKEQKALAQKIASP